jgi:hypothetical protein
MLCGKDGSFVREACRNRAVNHVLEAGSAAIEAPAENRDAGSSSIRCVEFLAPRRRHATIVPQLAAPVRKKSPDEESPERASARWGSDALATELAS